MKVLKQDGGPYIYLLEKDGDYLIGEVKELTRINKDFAKLPQAYNGQQRLLGWTIVERQTREYAYYYDGDLKTVGTARELAEVLDMRLPSVRHAIYRSKFKAENGKTDIGGYMVALDYEVHDFIGD